MDFNINGGNRYDRMFQRLNAKNAQNAEEAKQEESQKASEKEETKPQTEEGVKFPVENNRDVVPRTFYAAGPYANFTLKPTTQNENKPELEIPVTPDEPEEPGVPKDPDDPEVPRKPMERVNPDVNQINDEAPVETAQDEYDVVEKKPNICVYGPGPQTDNTEVNPDTYNESEVITITNVCVYGPGPQVNNEEEVVSAISSFKELPSTGALKSVVEDFVTSHQPPEANGDYRPFIPPAYYDNRMDSFQDTVNKFLDENNVSDSLKQAINELFDNARSEGNMDITSLGKAIVAKFNEEFNQTKVNNEEEVVSAISSFKELPSTGALKSVVEDFVDSHQPPKADGDYRPFIPPSYYDNRMDFFQDTVNKFLDENNISDSLKQAINELFDNARSEGNMDITSLGKAIVAKFNEEFNQTKVDNEEEVVSAISSFKELPSTGALKSVVEDFVDSHQPPKADGDYRPFIPPAYYEDRMDSFQDTVNKFLDENNISDSLKQAINELFDNARSEGNMDITSLGEAIIAKFNEQNPANDSGIETAKKEISIGSEPKPTDVAKEITMDDKNSEIPQEETNLDKIDESKIKSRFSQLYKMNRKL